VTSCGFPSLNVGRKYDGRKVANFLVV